MNQEYSRPCPKCHKDIFYKGIRAKDNCKYANNKGSLCYSCSNTADKNPQFGKKLSDVTRQKLIDAAKNKYSLELRDRLSRSQTFRFSSKENRNNTRISVLLAMHRPDVRKKHLAALEKSKWIKVRADIGQLELLQKWNQLGFHFEPNYQVKTDTDLFYVDGYDPINNVVFEYDSKYHSRRIQKKKDLIRQAKIMNILKPKKFWRYDASTQSFQTVTV